MSAAATSRTQPDEGTLRRASRWLERRAAGWLPLVVLPAAVLSLADDLPPWALMWSLAVSIYAGCKWLTWFSANETAAPLWKHAAYLMAWPGLDAQAFLSDRSSKVARPTAAEWCFAATKFAFGAVLLFGAARFMPAEWPYVVGWVGMAGIAMLLHFGLFHLLSCAWRSVGVEARPLMNWPLAATSVSDYWGRRWNTAFRDLAHRFLFQPLSAVLGPRGALLLGFLFSGVVHDVVISVPARGGYGAPTLFFVLQAVAMLFERSPRGGSLGLGRGWRGRAFALGTILIPAPLLFHAPFVVETIVPFMRAIGAV